MGRRLDLAHLSEEECEQILEVIQRDFTVREREKKRLDDTEQELSTENEKRKLLSASSKFNHNCCIRCCTTFGLLFNRKRVCYACRFNVCSNCSKPDGHEKLFICSVCAKQRELLTQSCDWFYKYANRRFKRFGSAKVVRCLHKRRSGSDTESDGGRVGGGYSNKYRGTVQGLFDTIQCLDSNTFLETTDHLINRYRNEVSDVQKNLKRLLASKTTDTGRSAINIDNKAVLSYKQRVSNSLRNLAQGLHMAFEDIGADNPSYSVVNKQVQSILINEVEEYVGKEISLPSDEFDDTVSENESVVESIAESHTSPNTVLDALAQAVIFKVINNYNEDEESRIMQQKEKEAIKELEELAEFSMEINFSPSDTVVQECIDEENSDKSSAYEELLPLSAEREQYLLTTPSTSYPEELNNLNTQLNDISRTHFGPHQSFTQTQFLGKASPLPSFEPSPLGHDEIDFDNLSSVKEFYMEDDENFVADNWLMRGNLGEQSYTRPGKPSSSEFNITMPQFSHRSSPMVGNREVDELSDLTSVGASDITDDDEPGDDDTAVSLSSVEEEAEEQFLDENNPVAINSSHESCDKLLGTVKIDNSAVSECVGKSVSESSLLQSHNVKVLCTNNSTDPVFELFPLDTCASEGEMIRFSCRLSGTSPIDVFWYRDDGSDIKQLEDDSKNDIYWYNGTFYLDVYNTVETDTGSYLCIGINENGQCSHTVSAKIKENYLDMHKPEFISHLTDKEITEGAFVKFSIRVKGYPVPKITWFKDGKKMKSDNKYRITKIGNRCHELLIDCAMMEEEAEYAVIASNIVGEVKTYAQLIVEQTTPIKDTMKKPNNKMVITPKSNRRLADLTERVSKTREAVTYTAENVLTSAEKMSSLDRDLDEMEKRLTCVESENKRGPDIDACSSPDYDNFEDIFAQYATQKEAAANIRAVTSTVLSILTSPEQSIKKHSSVTGNSTATIDNKTVESSRNHSVRSKKGNVSNLPHWSCNSPPPTIYNQIISDESKYNPLPIKIKHAENYTELGSDSSISPYERTDSSSSRVDIMHYKQEYVVNTDPEQKRSKIAAKVEDYVSETEDQIYMVAGDMFSLEEKIKNLERHINNLDDDTPPESIEALEAEVARAVAKVTQSENRVSHIEKHVGDLQHVNHTELQTLMSLNSEVDSGMSTGATTPVELMSPRSSIERSSPTGNSNDEVVKLPSVKRLSAMFDSTPLPDQRTILSKRSSLTGRTAIPARETSKDSPSGVRSKIYKQPTLSRRPKSDLFEPLSKNSKMTSNISLKEAELQQQPRTVPNPVDRSDEHIVYPKKKNIQLMSEFDTATQKHSKSNILARAAFWNTRINENISSDHDIRRIPTTEDNQM